MVTERQVKGLIQFLSVQLMKPVLHLQQLNRRRKQVKPWQIDEPRPGDHPFDNGLLEVEPVFSAKSVIKDLIGRTAPVCDVVVRSSRFVAPPQAAY